MEVRLRLDRAPGHRPAFEAARRKILATQDICGICGKPVDKTLKSPHPMSATVDHIIPLDKGGHPSDLSNLQLAHRCCNREKSNKLVREVYAQNTIDNNKVVSNRVLEQHNDWKSYKAK
jgi:5-methylcytosine-specific restriction endonuclease McrA